MPSSAALRAKNLCGICTKMPAPSPARGSAPTAPPAKRWPDPGSVSPAWHPPLVPERAKPGFGAPSSPAAPLDASMRTESLLVNRRLYPSRGPFRDRFRTALRKPFAQGALSRAFLPDRFRSGGADRQLGQHYCPNMSNLDPERKARPGKPGLFLADCCGEGFLDATRG